MKKYVLAGTALLALCASNVASAAAPSVAGKSFNLTGKFGGSVAVTCRIGGTHGAKIPSRKNLSAHILFNEDGTFEWTNDTLSAGVISGDWTQSPRNGKIDLDFDNPSAVSFIQLFGESFSTGLPGGSAMVTPTKYEFAGKLNGKSTTLKVVESGGFKIDASASVGGGSNACKYKVRIKRTYSGKAE